MEAIGSAAAVIQLVELTLRVTTALVQYTRGVNNASSDRESLANEALVLEQILKRLSARLSDPRLDPAWIEQRQEILEQFRKTCADLVKTLERYQLPEESEKGSRLKAIKLAAKWPFSKPEVYALLERVTRIQQYANTLLVADQSTLLDLIDQKQQEVERKKLRLDILNWLTPLRMRRMQQTISERAEPGSGQWFLASQAFLDWERGVHNQLWCPGIPGAGKTVMASIVADRLLKQQRDIHERKSMSGVAIVYLSYNEQGQTMSAVLGSIIQQLLYDHDSIPDAIHEFYETHDRANFAPSHRQLGETLLTLCRTYFGQVFVILDALDECSDELRWGLLDFLRPIDNCQLLVTSRLLAIIEEELEGFSVLEIKASKADIEIFINGQIETNRNLKKMVSRFPAIRGEIHAGVVTTAQDMFLLARLHVDSLTNAAGLSVKHVRRKLESLPTTLHGTYEEAMKRIKSQDPESAEIAIQILAWVSYAFRSLSLKELQHALAIEPGMRELDEEVVMDGPTITALCAGLVLIDAMTENVSLVHYTTQHYFESHRDLYFPAFHSTITLNCATYLMIPALQDASIWDLVREFPFSSYAAQYMGDHARRNPEENLDTTALQAVYELLSHPDKRKPLLSLLDSLDLIRSGFYSAHEPEFGHRLESQDARTDDETTYIDPQTKGSTVDDDMDQTTLAPSVTDVDFVSSIPKPNGEITMEHKLQRIERRITEIDFESSHADVSNPETLQLNASSSNTLEVTALHLAASMGLARIASMLLQDTPNIDAVDETGKTALSVAIERGFEKAVEFLIKGGASINLHSENGQAVFLLLCEKDWLGSSDSLAQDLKKENAHSDLSIQLLLAAYSGNEEDLRQLLGKKVLESHDWTAFGKLALFLAVERNHLQVVRFLISAGVDIDSVDHSGQTSLHRATRRQSIPMMKLLLDMGATVDSKNDNGYTPWSANASTQNEAALTLLLRAGANPNVQDPQGISELYMAASKGRTEYVKFLLNMGTDPNIKTEFDWRPIHWAAHDGHIDTVRVLIDAHADVSAVSDQDLTALDLAIQANQTEIIELLKKAGAKRSVDVKGKTISQAHDLWKSRTYANTQNQDKSPAARKISLAFDIPFREPGINFPFGQFVYAVKQPNDRVFAPYQISHLLDTVTDTIRVRRAESRAKMSDYPLPPEAFIEKDVLYSISRITQDYQELKLEEHTDGLGIGTITLHRDWTGSWKTYREVNGKVNMLFRTHLDWSVQRDAGARWLTEDGTLLARTVAQENVLTFEPWLDSVTQDILVGTWIGRIWAEQVSANMHVKLAD